MLQSLHHVLLHLVMSGGGGSVEPVNVPIGQLTLLLSDWLHNTPGLTR